jgi:hypothetical protein
MKKTLTRFYTPKTIRLEFLEDSYEGLKIIERSLQKIDRAYELIKEQGLSLGKLKGGFPILDRYEAFLLSKECLIGYIEDNSFNNAKTFIICGRDEEELNFVERRLKLNENGT